MSNTPKGGTIEGNAADDILMVDQGEECIAAGMHGNISKPIDPEALSRLLNRWSQQGLGVSQDRGHKTDKKHNPGKTGVDTPPVAFEKALERTLGDRDFLFEMLEEFTSKGPEWLKSIETLLQKCDGETLAQEAHTLKGAAANLGAERMAEFAVRLEEMGRSGDLSDGARVIDELEHEFESITQFISLQKNRS